jgi:hypothetical protein
MTDRSWFPVEYQVNPEGVSEFIKTMRKYGRIRRRDGASRWGICRDLEKPDRYHAPPGILSAASVAVQVGNTLYVGSAMGDRLLEIDLSVVTKHTLKDGLR